MSSLFRNRKLALYYFRYKDSPYYVGSFVVVTFIMAILLVWVVVLPQVNDFFSVNNEIKNTRERINILKNNITYLTSLNGVELDGQLAFFAHGLSPLPSPCRAACWLPSRQAPTLARRSALA